jgi:hypothetical protein
MVMLAYKYQVITNLLSTESVQKISEYTGKGIDYLNDLIGIRRRNCKIFIENELKASEEIELFSAEKELVSDKINIIRENIKKRNSGCKKRNQGTVQEKKDLKEFNSKKKEISKQLKLAKEIHRGKFKFPDEEFKRRVEELLAKENTTSTNKHAVARLNDVVLNEMLGELEWSKEWKVKALESAKVNKLQKEARQNRLSKLPGIYLHVEEAFEKIIKSKKIDPKFRFDREVGQIGVHQGGGGLPTPCSTKNLFVQNDAFRARLILNSNFNPDCLLREHNRPDETLLKYEIDSDKGVRYRKDRIAWVILKITPSESLRIPILYHRELPDNAILHRVCLSVKRKNGTLQYSIIFTISPSHIISDLVGDKQFIMVGIDRNWRKIGENRIRFAGRHYANSPDGDAIKDYPELPEKVLININHANYLRSVQDKIFGIVKKHCVDLIDPDLSKWKSSRKLRDRVFLYFQDKNILPQLKSMWDCWVRERKYNRIDLWEPDINVVDVWCLEHKYDLVKEFYIEMWRKKSKHLYQIECGVRNNGINLRKNFYHKMALEDHAKCKYACFENLDLDEMIRRAFPEQEKRPPSSYIRTIVAPGELLAEYKIVFGKDFILEVPPEYTSRNCPFCKVDMGHTTEIMIQHKCSKNKNIIELDRDDVASANIWGRGFERLGVLNKTAPSRNQINFSEINEMVA